MSRWVSGLAGSRNFMSVPVHTGGRGDVGQDTASDLIQFSHLLCPHSPGVLSSNREKAPLTAFPPTPLHSQGPEKKNTLMFGKKSAI